MQVILDTLEYGSAIKKTPVVVGNCTGFAVNRVFFPYTQACGWAAPFPSQGCCQVCVARRAVPYLWNCAFRLRRDRENSVIRLSSTDSSCLAGCVHAG